jgi:hypothetical protein
MKLPLILTIVVTLLCVFAGALHAQEAEFDIGMGISLIVEGEDFVFEQVLSTVEGEQVIEERAIWDGGVTARFIAGESEFTLDTDHVEVLFDGADVTRLEAGPKVIFTAMEGKARFECADVFIDFPTVADGMRFYSGVCRDVYGYYLAEAYELGLEGDEQYKVNFTADTALLGPDTATLESPALSLGDIDNPELAIRSRGMDFIIGEHPETGARELLAVRLANLVIDLYGNRVELMPFPLWHSFVDRHEPGLNIRFPMMGWEEDEYLRIDFRPSYDFNEESLDDGPRFTLRLDTFPFARTYPEIIGYARLGEFFVEGRTGYRREEDSEYEPVPTRAEPEFITGIRRIPLNDSGFGFHAEAFWGHLRDMRDGPDLDRWGYRASIDHTGIPIGPFTLKGMVEVVDYYYQGGSNYTVLDGVAHLRYVDPPHWGISFIYEKTHDWGESPFVFDVPQVIEELGVREQSRFSRRWGAGFDWAWDFADDEFERQECHLTYILDSFQVSCGWDFANETVRIRLDLPGSLR